MPLSVKVGGSWVNVGQVYVREGGTWKLVASTDPLAANFSNTATGTYSSGGFNYKYVTFASSGTLTITSAGVADILVVAGGGGGAGDTRGGGAGGYVFRTDYYIGAGSYAVTVGAGGPTGGGANCQNRGDHSRLDQLFAVAGGGGTSSGGLPGGAGGSSGAGYGGGGWNVPGQGNVGNSNGGGGGAGGAPSGTTGGAGVANSITGTSVTYAVGGNSTGAAAAGAGSGGGGANNVGRAGIVVVRVKV
jgi:hypothetical protein